MTRRVEDPRLLTGRGCFVADLRFHRLVDAVFVRSPHAHALLQAIDAEPARRAGARLVLTASDLPFPDHPLVVRRSHPDLRGGLPPPLARGRVRYVGEAVALVAADDRYAAEDVAEHVQVDYAPLAALASAEAARRSDAPQLHESWPGNVAVRLAQRVGDGAAALVRAERRLAASFRIPRQAPVPLEPRGLVVRPEPGGGLTAWVSTQVPATVRANLAAALGLAPARVRVIAPDVGGGFGAKSRAYPEEPVVAWAALRLGRPVRWIEDRLEHLLATCHSRDVSVEAEVGYTAGGHLQALRVRAVVDVGAYVHGNGVITAEVLAAQLPGPYRLPHYEAEVECVGTTKTPLATYRGAGQPEATFVMERLLDLVAKDLGLSPLEIRRRNLLGPDELPRARATRLGGIPVVLDSGDYPALLARAVERAGYRAEPAAGPGPHEVAADGLALGLEATGLGGPEQARVRLEADGSVRVDAGVASQGQGQATTLARLCAETLGVPVARVHVHLGDTASLPEVKGTFASRSALLGGNAVARAAACLRDRILGAAARRLGVRPTELATAEGRVFPRGRPAQAVTLADVAAYAAAEGTGPLEATAGFGVPGDAMTYAASAHVARVAVDRRTGIVRLLDYVVVHDAGRVLHPAVVEGQVVGGVVEGLGGALLGALAYDGAGQLLTGSLVDYLLPLAPGLPPIRVAHCDTPATTNPLGIRGVGEGGTLPVAAAVANAVGRALGAGLHAGEAELSVLPLTPERVLRAASASGTAAGGPAGSPGTGDRPR